MRCVPLSTSTSDTHTQTQTHIWTLVRNKNKTVVGSCGFRHHRIVLQFMSQIHKCYKTERVWNGKMMPSDVADKNWRAYDSQPLYVYFLHDWQSHGIEKKQQRVYGLDLHYVCDDSWYVKIAWSMVISFDTFTCSGIVRAACNAWNTKFTISIDLVSSRQHLISFASRTFVKIHFSYFWNLWLFNLPVCLTNVFSDLSLALRTALGMRTKVGVGE